MTNAANRQDVRRKEKESKIAELEQAEVDAACAERINDTAARREAEAATRARLEAIRTRVFATPTFSIAAE